MAEGARQTRQGRLAYGGLRSDNPQATSIALIAVNVGVWIAVMAGGGRASQLLDYLMLRPTGVCLADRFWFPNATESACGPAGGTWYPGVADGAPWQMVTSMFTHVEVWHIGFNMLALWALGPQLEMILGRWRFVVLYLVAGLGGSTMVYLLADPQSATLGASGAVFGLMGGLLVVAHKVGGNYQSILGWIAANFVITFVVSGISWQGHVGGFVTGAVVAGLLVYAPRARRTQVQVAGMVAVMVVLAVLDAMRTAALA
ncbi:MAG: rhomboid family intramembrane serine protease [Nocardioides sp.]